MARLLKPPQRAVGAIACNGQVVGRDGYMGMTDRRSPVSNIKTKMVLLVLSASVFAAFGAFRVCNEILNFVATPITVLGALDQLGWVNINPA